MSLEKFMTSLMAISTTVCWGKRSSSMAKKHLMNIFVISAILLLVYSQIALDHSRNETPPAGLSLLEKFKAGHICICISHSHIHSYPHKLKIQSLLITTVTGHELETHHVQISL
jgi:tryptophan-rich sensory protein